MLKYTHVKKSEELSSILLIILKHFLRKCSKQAPKIISKGNFKIEIATEIEKVSNSNIGAGGMAQKLHTHTPLAADRSSTPAPS